MSESGKSPSVLLAHVHVACKRTIFFIEGMKKGEFLRDERTQHAVAMALLTVGEAVTRILRDHEQFAAEHPELELHKVKGMRNRIAHGYFELDFDVVWSTANDVLPVFLERVDAVLEKIAPHQCLLCMKNPCECGNGPDGAPKF